MKKKKKSERAISMEMESCVPPGFRFHPTEEELVGYYLKRKINALKIDLDVIVDVDLYKIEPWDIQDLCKLGYDEQNEWYFFSHKDKKYPTGTRTNRATVAGFWKATGRDKAVLSKNRIIGMRKTLVFYKGRAPNGRKSDWIMHEYRLQTSEHAPPQEEGWVVCRAFRKPSPSHHQRPPFEAWSQHYYARPQSSTDYPETKALIGPNSQAPSFHTGFPPAHQDHQALLSTHNFSHEALPQLDSPSSVSASFTPNEATFLRNDVVKGDYSNETSDWPNLDCFLETQLTNPSSFANADAFASPSFPPCDYNEQRALNSHFHGCFPETL